MPVIPLHQLLHRSDTGLEIYYFRPGDPVHEPETLKAHRDDHYIFFLVASGSAELMIDFERIAFVPGTLYFVLPGQVHHRISNAMAYGWFMAVDTGLLTAEQRQVFEQRLLLQQPVHLDKESQERYRDVLQPLYRHYESDTGGAFYRPILYALLQAFTGMVAAEFKGAEKQDSQPSRKMQLAQAFKQQLSLSYKTLKSPSAYAERLNVSAAYLNEALKHVTGLPVSYWISQEVMLEAKRLLYYTRLSVKEIAQELGYQDQAYFFRFFRQHSGITPLAFRAQYHE
jgi:AraC-like DNA-binding protein